MLTPYYKDPDADITIYCGDCLEIMKEFPDKSFDLVVTSPPFNLGNTHHTGNIRHQAYDDDMSEEEYQDWQIKILNELYRITEGSLIYQHKNRIKNKKQITPYQWILKTQWIVNQELIWFNGSQNFDKCRFYPMTERLYWLRNSDVKFNNTINAHDLFKWNAEGTSKKHSRTYPKALVLDMLNCFDGVILDPFLGSGTTLVACKELKRRGVGIEISEKYCAIAKRRLQNTIVPMF